MVERGFDIRYETAKTLMQNSGLKPSSKKKNKIVVEAMLTACFLNEECPQKEKTQSVIEMFLETREIEELSLKTLSNEIVLGLLQKKRTKPSEMINKGTVMMFVGYALDHLREKMRVI